MGFPEYEGFVIGKEVGPLEITVDERRVRDFIYAIDDFNPWHISDSPFGGPIAPVPLLTSDDPEFAALLDPGKQDAFAARYELRSLQPIRIGEQVTLRMRNVCKYIRRSKGYIVRDLEVRLARNGRPLMSSKLTETIGAHPGGSVPDSGEPPSSERHHVEPRESRERVVGRAHRDVPQGSPLPRLTKTVTRKQIFVFSARPGWWTSIHSDPDFARSRGFPTAIAQGLMSTGYIGQLCTEFFQQAWFRTGSASLAFIRPVCIDDVLTVEGRVAGRTREPDGRTRLELEVWCKNQNGELATVGHAGAVID